MTCFHSMPIFGYVLLSVWLLHPTQNDASVDLSVYVTTSATLCHSHVLCLEKCCSLFTCKSSVVRELLINFQLLLYFKSQIYNHTFIVICYIFINHHRHLYGACFSEQMAYNKSSKGIKKSLIVNFVKILYRFFKKYKKCINAQHKI